MIGQGMSLDAPLASRLTLHVLAMLSPSFWSSYVVDQNTRSDLVFVELGHKFVQFKEGNS